MKSCYPILRQNCICIPLRRLLTLLLVCAGLMTGSAAKSQCTTGGYNQVSLNWDILDWLTDQANYTADNYINPTSLAFTQNFAFGSNNRMTITVNNNIDLGGEVGTHTGDLANYVGDDVMFTPTANNQTIVITFETPVENPNFTIYDIERQQVIQVSATNNLSLPVGALNITPQGTTILSVGGFLLGARSVTASNTSSNNDNTGSATIAIPGLVRTITLNFTNFGNSNQDIYLSDIRACINGNFPLNYYAVAQPFTGQPGYVLHAFDRSVYYVNPANGFTRLLFTDAGGLGNINSLAYDPYNRWIYYVYSLTNGGNIGDETTMKKYDVNTGVITTLVADLETIGLPTTDGYGTESGSAAFYNGAYYIGVETSGNSRNSLRESVIWRLDFNGSNVPYRCSQVFAVQVDSSGLLLHDWSDFVIYDGILYNFDAAENDTRRACGACPDYTPQQRNQSDIYHVSMMSGAMTRYTKPGNAMIPFWYPGQPAITWNGTVVQMFASSGTPSWAGAMPASNPYVTNYNGAGGIGAPIMMFSTPAFTPASPSLGDAAEAFKPRSDFGDAPATYDNSVTAPATHEIDPLIRLGGSVISEWSRTNSALANAEGAEENAVGAPPALNYNATFTYTIPNVSVFNNTGGNATLLVWLDHNFNGTFEASEGRSFNVPSSGSLQNINAVFTNIWVPMTSALRTFVRFRITRASNGMTTANMNGWFPDGEVEDFPVTLGAALPEDLTTFNVKKEVNATVNVKWTIDVQQPVQNFEVMRSTDNTNWTRISTVSARAGSGSQNYTYTDLSPVPGKSYYRIAVNYTAAGANKLSEIRSVEFSNGNVYVRVLPNPAHEKAELQINASGKGDAVVRVYDRSGRMVMNMKQTVDAGANTIWLNNLSTLAEGVYTVRTVLNGRTSSNQLIIKKQ